MDLPKGMIGTAATPATNHLFRVDDENAAPLDKDRADLFIHLMMQLMSRYPNSNFVPMQVHTASRQP